MIKKLKENYFFAVIRGKNEDDACEISRQAILGGIKNVEITFSTPNATEVICKLSEEFKNDSNVIVGAGTVMNGRLAKEAIKAGAKFLVSPHFSNEIQAIARNSNILYFPGCATVTEIVTAMESGCEIIKVFPGGVLGPSFIKDVHGPIPEVNLMPSGGVSIDNVKEWQKCGACAVGIGSALSCKVQDEGYESVKVIAEQFVSALER